MWLLRANVQPKSGARPLFRSILGIVLYDTKLFERLEYISERHDELFIQILALMRKDKYLHCRMEARLSIRESVCRKLPINANFEI